MRRFWSKVEKGEGCWHWTGSIKASGYGQFRFRGKPWQAHRVAWTLERGEIPNGLHVLHRCDVPSCVNPEHLFLGTHADNMADMVEKGRHAYEPHLGEDHAAAKLTRSEVKAIKHELLMAASAGDPPGTYRDSRGLLRDADTHRFLPDQGGRTQEEIADDYGVSREAVKDIKSGKNWSHVEVRAER